MRNQATFNNTQKYIVYFYFGFKLDEEPHFIRLLVYRRKTVDFIILYHLDASFRNFSEKLFGLRNELKSTIKKGDTFKRRCEVARARRWSEAALAAIIYWHVIMTTHTAILASIGVIN